MLELIIKNSIDKFFYCGVGEVNYNVYYYTYMTLII